MRRDNEQATTANSTIRRELTTIQCIQLDNVAMVSDAIHSVAEMTKPERNRIRLHSVNCFMIAASKGGIFDTLRTTGLYEAIKLYVAIVLDRPNLSDLA